MAFNKRQASSLGTEEQEGKRGREGYMLTFDFNEGGTRITRVEEYR